jgi:hypothetical protein
MRIRKRLKTLRLNAQIWWLRVKRQYLLLQRWKCDKKLAYIQWKMRREEQLRLYLESQDFMEGDDE